MKSVVFRHYLKRSLTDPVGIGIISGLPTLLIIILSMVMTGQVPEGTEYMRNGYNIVSTHIAIMFTVSFQFFGGSVLLDHIHKDFRGDRRWRMLSMPVKINDYIFGIFAACLTFCIIQGAVVVVVSAIFLDVYWGNIFVLIAALIACAVIAQLMYILFFLLFEKKGTVEALGQGLTWVMMVASGWIGFGGESAGTAFNNFFTKYGTPISLARNAVTNSGFIGNDMSNSILSLGILYAWAAAFSIIVTLIGKKTGFSPDKYASVSSGSSGPGKKEKIPARKETIIQDFADVSKQKDLILISPSGSRGGQFTIFKYALLRACRNPLSIFVNAAIPLILVFIPGLWRGEFAMGYSLIGVTLMYGSFIAARGILRDKLDGTITRIFTAPVTSARYLSQNLLAAVTPLTVLILAIGVAGIVLHSWETGFALSLTLIYFLFAAASVAFSFAWSCLFKDKEMSYSMFSVLMSLVAMLGGFFIPLSVLPDVLKFIGALFPAFWLSNGILYLQGGAAMGNYYISAAVIIMFFALYMLFGSKRRVI